MLGTGRNISKTFCCERRKLMFPGTAGHLDYREMFLQRGMIHSGPPRVPNLMVLPAPQPPPFTHTHTLISGLGFPGASNS